MASTTAWCVVLLVSSAFLCCSGQSPGTASGEADSLNAVIRNYALRGSVQLRTGLAYQVPLPANFFGMEASAMRLRTGSLWTRGANISGFRVPPRTLAAPFQRRLVLVYQNLGNWSDSYYRFPGHSAVTPVLGLLAYGAPTNSSSAKSGDGVQLKLTATGLPISVRFTRVFLPPGTPPAAARCAKFEPNGTVRLDEVGTSNVCTTRSPGHLAIVVPSPSPAPAPGIPAEGRGRNRASWRVWLAACAAAGVGLVLVGLAGGGIFQLIKNKRMEEMEEQAEVGEGLKTVWVGCSRMPSATMVRTRPVVEEGTSP